MCPPAGISCEGMEVPHWPDNNAPPGAGGQRVCAVVISRKIAMRRAQKDDISSCAAVKRSLNDWQAPPDRKAMEDTVDQTTRRCFCMGKVASGRILSLSKQWYLFQICSFHSIPTEHFETVLAFGFTKKMSAQPTSAQDRALGLTPLLLRGPAVLLLC